MQLRATADRAAVDLVVHTFGLARAEHPLSDRAEVVISTLPAHAADPLAERAWSDRVVLLDAVYADWPTALARAVAAAGGQAVSGIEMLLHQAAEQVRLMTGHAGAAGRDARRPPDPRLAAVHAAGPSTATGVGRFLTDCIPCCVGSRPGNPTASPWSGSSTGCPRASS